MRCIGGSWNLASISAMSAIFGSLTGALASSVSTWITQRHQDRRDLLAKRIFHLEQLYLDFISEGARVMADAKQHNFQDPSMLLPAYALLSRMRLNSSPNVRASAELIIKKTSSALIRNLTLLPGRFGRAQARARIRYTNSAYSAVLSLKQCRMNCGNVRSQESLARRPNPSRVCSRLFSRRSQHFQQICHLLSRTSSSIPL